MVNLNNLKNEYFFFILKIFYDINITKIIIQTIQGENYYNTFHLFR